MFSVTEKCKASMLDHVFLWKPPALIIQHLNRFKHATEPTKRVTTDTIWSKFINLA